MANNIPLRENIHQLTEAFVESLFLALRKAIIEGVAREADNARGMLREGLASVTPAAKIARTAPPAVGRKPSGRERPPSGRVQRTKPVSVVEEATEATAAEFEETLVSDPELMLAAFEGTVEPVAARRKVRSKGAELLEEPAAVVEDEGAPEAEALATGPALREDEVAVQTPGGGVVIRRKRNGAQAA